MPVVPFAHTRPFGIGNPREGNGFDPDPDCDSDTEGAKAIRDIPTRHAPD
jgi:hypothetical protein